jgi:hypothetical protein
MGKNMGGWVGSRDVVRTRRSDSDETTRLAMIPPLDPIIIITSRRHPASSDESSDDREDDEAEAPGDDERCRLIPFPPWCGLAAGDSNAAVSELITESHATSIRMLFCLLPHCVMRCRSSLDVKPERHLRKLSASTVIRISV